MRLGWPTFWGMIVGVAAILFGAGTDVISNHQLVNQIVVALSGIALAGLTINQAFPQPVGAVFGRIRALRQPRMPGGYISLHDAADRLLDETLNTPLRSAAIGSGHTLNGTWDWLGFYMARRGMTIYGRHPATKTMHTVPAEHFAFAGMRGGAREMVRDGFPTWTDLAVRVDEFERRLEDLKRMD